jgi:hypothetical protein
MKYKSMAISSLISLFPSPAFKVKFLETYFSAKETYFPKIRALQRFCIGFTRTMVGWIRESGLDDCIMTTGFGGALTNHENKPKKVLPDFAGTRTGFKYRKYRHSQSLHVFAQTHQPEIADPGTSSSTKKTIALAPD